MSQISVVIKASGEEKHTVSIAADATVAELKEAVAQATGCEASRQRLIFSGKVLKDPETLSFYSIKDGCAVHMVKGPAKKSDAGSAAAPAASAASGSSEPASAPAASSINAGQPTFNPLAGLTDARYAGYNIPMPSLDQLGMNADGMAMPSEEQMSSMMDSPMFQESMRSMLSNPQMLDYLIEQSPQLRAMGPAAREMLQSDYMRNMLTNPQAMRSMMEFQRAMGGGGLGGAGMGESSFPAPGNPAGADSGATGTTSPSANTSTPPVNPFASMFGAGAGAPGGFGANPFAAFGMPPVSTPAPVDTRPPEEVYATQLGQLNDMGFYDFEQNVRALRRAGGRVDGALEMLLNGNV